MHELGRLIQSLMDAESMTAADLARRAGLTRQHVSNLLTTDSLSRLPEARTFQGLCQAFPTTPPAWFVLAAAKAVGVPVGATSEEPDYSLLTNDALLGILRNRLEGGQQDGRMPEAEKSTDAPPMRYLPYAARRDPNHKKR